MRTSRKMKATKPQPWLAASTNAARPILQNVLLASSEGSEDSFDVTATDGRILVHCPGFLFAPDLGRKAWLVNAKAFGAVVKAAGTLPPAVDRLKLVLTARHAAGSVSADLIDEAGRFPAWRHLVPTGGPTDSAALLNPYLYHRLAKAMGLADDGTGFDCETYGATKAVKVTTSNSLGLIMPIFGKAAERERE